MKSSTLAILTLTAAFVVLALPSRSTGQQLAQATSSSTTTATAPMQWTSDISEILKLVHAGVAQEVIAAYIVNSGRTYSLSAADIIELKQQGVSDLVLTTMLQQSQKQPRGGLHVAASPAPATSSPEASSAQYAPVATSYATPAAEPVYAYPSYAYSPYYYPYYGGYYGYPAVSFSFGFGGCYGGYYHGGGFHGGGGHGGHH